MNSALTHIGSANSCQHQIKETTHHGEICRRLMPITSTLLAHPLPLVVRLAYVPASKSFVDEVDELHDRHDVLRDSPCFREPLLNQT
jgi:hypothetical protein